MPTNKKGGIHYGANIRYLGAAAAAVFAGASQRFSGRDAADRSAEEMLDRLVREMATAEGVTEALKARDQMAWMGQMNNIRQRAEEIVRRELICV